MNEEKRNELTMLLAVFLFWVSVYTYSSFLSSYSVNVLGATKVMAGMIVGGYGLVQLILRIPLGIASDYFRKRKIFVVIAFAIAIIASAGLAVVAVMAGRENVPKGLPEAAMIFRGLAGVTAAAWVNFSVLYSSASKGKQVAASMSLLVMTQSSAKVAGMLLGSLLADRFGEVWAFVLAAAAAAAGLIVMTRVKDQVPEGEPMTVKGFLETAKNRELIIGTLLATIYQLVVWATVQGFVQNWARDVIGITTAQLGFLSVANLLPNIILSRLSGSVLAPKFGRKTILAAGFVFIAAACALYPYTDSLVSLLLVHALLGGGVGLIAPLTMASAIETVPNEKRGAAMGIYQAVYSLGMFVGPVLAGAVIEKVSGAAADTVPVKGYIANFYVAMAIALLGGVLAVLLTGKRKNGSPKAE